MRALTRRRLIGVTALAGMSVMILATERLLSHRLFVTTLYSGWLLFALVAALALFSARKKIPVIPLGRASTWLQIHIYTGLFATVVFLLHIGWRLPNGVFETTLAAVFALVVLSGLLGLLISRDNAHRLTSRGVEVIFERIPALRRRLEERAEELVLAAVAEDGATAIADFYTRKLGPYFGGPRNVVFHLFESRRPRLHWEGELAALDRYLSDSERRCAREIGELVRMKDDLDHHYALQGALKLWLFVHIPATSVLLVLAVCHALLAQAFS